MSDGFDRGPPNAGWLKLSDTCAACGKKFVEGDEVMDSHITADNSPILTWHVGCVDLQKS